MKAITDGRTPDGRPLCNILMTDYVTADEIETKKIRGVDLTICLEHWGSNLLSYSLPLLLLSCPFPHPPLLRSAYFPSLHLTLLPPLLSLPFPV